MHPREFGKFRILKLLPKGGMGTVYLALNTQTQEEVALKLIELGPRVEAITPTGESLGLFNSVTAAQTRSASMPAPSGLVSGSTMTNSSPP